MLFWTTQEDQVRTIERVIAEITETRSRKVKLSPALSAGIDQGEAVLRDLLDGEGLKPTRDLVSGVVLCALLVGDRASFMEESGLLPKDAADQLTVRVNAYIECLVGMIDDGGKTT